jgi:phosphoadenosine phosphosulfate reductase
MVGDSVLALTEQDLIVDYEQGSAAFDAADPRFTLAWATQTYGEKLAMGTGFGPEGIVILDLLCQVNACPRVFYLDTDFLFPETYGLRDKLAKRYGIEFEQVRSGLSPLVQSQHYGPDLWARNPDLCCRIRKVEPMSQYLASVDAWITSIRRDQTTARATTEVVEWNEKFRLVKISPLATWNSEQVWDYIRKHKLPYNPLHDRSYPSIGCIQCTDPVDQGDDPRAGRWSWTTKTECGLHQ